MCWGLGRGLVMGRNKKISYIDVYINHQKCVSANSLIYMKRYILAIITTLSFYTLKVRYKIIAEREKLYNYSYIII